MIGVDAVKRMEKFVEFTIFSFHLDYDVPKYDSVTGRCLASATNALNDEI